MCFTFQPQLQDHPKLWEPDAAPAERIHKRFHGSTVTSITRFFLAKTLYSEEPEPFRNVVRCLLN